MTTSKRLVQAYRQAPWRIQTQRVALILIVAVLGASVLWVMLSVTVQAATAGLEIQEMEIEQENLMREIANLRTQYAILTSAEQMEQRAQDMGFEPITPENITYVVVPGYAGREPVIKASPPTTHIEQPLIKPGFTQSLWEWMIDGLLEISETPGGRVTP
jgi:cell division protein FtsB